MVYLMQTLLPLEVPLWVTVGSLTDNVLDDQNGLLQRNTNDLVTCLESSVHVMVMFP